MKKTYSIFGKDVLVTVENRENNAVHALQFTAKCGETMRQGVMTLALTEDETADHAQKKVDDFGRTLAQEAANHERTRLIKNKLLADE